MKKLLLLLALSATAFITQAQTTYYWVGAPGSAGAPTAWSSGWNTAADGSGNPRTASSGTDILVFDGNSLAVKTLWVGSVPKDSAAELRLINGVTVTVTTTNGNTVDAAESVDYGAVYGGAVIPVIAPNLAANFRLGDYITSGAGGAPSQVLGFSGADTMYVSNEGSVNSSFNIFRVPTLYIKGNPGLTIDGTSVLNMGASSTTTLTSFALVLSAGATGSVSGRISFQSRGLNARVSAVSPMALAFKAGSTATAGATGSTGGSRGFHFGNTFVTGSSAGGTLNFINDGGRVVFERGSTYSHAAQQNSPLGTATSITGTTSLTFAQAITFQTGSTYLQTYGNGYLPYFYSNGASYANIVWNNGGFPGTTTTTFYMNPVRVDTLTFLNLGSPTGASAATRIPIYGDYVNNSASTITIPNMYFAGNGVQQRIAGTNTTTKIANLFILDSANVVLERNQEVTTGLNVLGTLNMNNYRIIGSGAATNFNNYSTYSRVFNSPAGSNNDIGGAAITAGSTTIHLRNMNNTNSNIIGSKITSTSHPTAIQPGTFITGYSGSGNFTISRPATITADSSSSPVLSLAIAHDAGTVVVSNTAGLEGALQSFGTFTLGSTANYTFNSPTTTPFPTAVASPVSVGNLTLNANVTLNKAVTQVRGTLALNSNILTVSATDTLRLSTSNAVTGTLGASAHINTMVNETNGNAAYVVVDTINTTRTIPVGNNGSYLPVTITPSSINTFAVSVKQGATNNGMPNGTPLTTSEKANVVDANYIVNRLAGAGDAVLRLGFPASLKGSGFAGIQNEQLGVARFNGTTWEAPRGGGDNTINFAQGVFSEFSPFRVEVFLNGTLPVSITNVSAAKSNGKVVVTWKVMNEVNLDKYVVERSVDGFNFSPIGSVSATGSAAYSFNDAMPANGKNLYRLRSYNRDNSSIVSKVVLVDFSLMVNSLSVSPNPISNGYFTVGFKNLKAGKVSVRLFNNNGQLVMDQLVDHNGSNDNQLINLSSRVAKGIYQLVISDGTNAQKTSVVIQ
ncbi:T9SS type A sorting domain-containing protein [Aridibaculum aurantiacum]|uniref:T9SS type A sorting domain-containing protein n=1 Tax=Aridibaculum aurantiacum TaxID=2810307 RepID=UPI001A965362|nr:T9SS type A sorting domain-containing protein [Aridibaculum aurantiacum]